MKTAKFTKGNSVAFVSRSFCVRRLQISLNSFRRLCILTSTYPREPPSLKKANKGSTLKKSFYSKKDLLALLSHPLLKTLRAEKTWLKKCKLASLRHETTRLERLLAAKPVTDYSYILSQKYPNYEDALKDLADTLTLAYLCSSLPHDTLSPHTDMSSLPHLLAGWEALIIKNKALVKTFLSVKGVYYQVVMSGVPITYLVPYTSSASLSIHVDYRVLERFLSLFLFGERFERRKIGRFIFFLLHFGIRLRIFL